MSQPVYYTSATPGFPAGNTRVAGGLIAVLDACLVNGANLTTAVTLTQTAGVATVTFAGNHNFTVGDSVLLEGATPAGYNGRAKVTAKTADSISFAVDSGLATPAAGTITVKHPGAGWTKTWSDGNKAAYRSATADGGVGAYMQIEDDNPYSDSFDSFRWRACEGHSGLDAATRLATDARRFYKATSTARWVVVADEKTAYINFLSSSDTTAHDMFVMGEAQRLVPTDVGAWVFPGHSATGAGQLPSRPLTHARRTVNADSFPVQAMRTWAGFGATPNCVPSLLGGFNQYGYDANLLDVQGHLSATNPLTGHVGLFPIQLLEQVSTGDAGQVHRGTFRGAYQVGGRLSAGIFNSVLTTKLDLPDLGGSQKELLVLRTGSSGNEQLAFDLTGPWGV